MRYLADSPPTSNCQARITFNELRDLLAARNWPHRHEGHELRLYCPEHGGGALTASDKDGSALLY